MKRFSMMQTFYALLLIVFCSPLVAQNNPSGPWMKYQSPEEAGFDTEKLELVNAQLDKMYTSSLMVVYKGNVLLTSGDVSRRFLAHSIRKSFMSAIYGIHVDNGNINLYATLGELGIDDKLGLTDLEKTARVHDLITARSGIYHPAAYEPGGMKDSRPERGTKRPGEAYFYNNWDFNTLLPIIEQEAKIKFFDEFYNQIANPLGMEDLRKRDMRYRYEPDLSNHAAYLFKMSTRDMARFGQLYLNKGKWGEKQIVPEHWVNRSTAAYTMHPPGFEDRGGYGYLWWVDHETFNQPMYFASGLGGHRIMVLPESDMVIVHRVNSYLNMGVRNSSLEELVQLVLNAKTEQTKDNPKLVELKVNRLIMPDFQLSKKDFAQLAGVYKHPFFDEITLYEEDDKYFMKGEVMGVFQIFFKSKTEFVVEDLPELPGEFRKATAENPKGTATTEVNERRIPTKFVMYN